MNKEHRVRTDTHLKPVDIVTALSSIAAQENNDSSEYDLMVEAADYILQLREEAEKMKAAIMVVSQTLLEVSHAQDVGANWYTRGHSGLFAQIRMQVAKGVKAIKELNIDQL